MKSLRLDKLTKTRHTGAMLPIAREVNEARSLEAKLQIYASHASVDPESSIPLHYQLFRILKQFARKYDLTTDDKLPGEELVAQVFGVSRPTATRAIRGFVDRRQLTRTPGRGSFFRSEQRLDLTLLTNSLSVREAVRPPQRLSTQVITQCLADSVPHEVEELGLLRDTAVVALRRLRSVDGQPVMVCDSYLPAELFPGLEGRDLVDGSLYATLFTVYDTRIVRSNRFIEVAEVVDHSVIQLLGVPILSPVFLLTGASYDEAGRLCEAIVSYIIGEARFGSTVEAGAEAHTVAAREWTAE